MARPHWQFDRTSGNRVLDFANTVSDRHAQAPVDHLADYESLLAFARQTRLLESDRARTLERAARRDPDAAGRVATEAVALRESLYRILTAVAESEAPPSDALLTLNAFADRLRIGPELQWRWTPAEHGLDEPLGPLVVEALALVTGSERGRIGVCGNPSCRFLFLDTTKNHSRRWCEMETCGNRMKARRHYRRTRDANA